MAYRFALAGGDHRELAGILHSAPGFPAFPVRLADEIFRHARVLRPGRPLSVWDPCCGSGQLLTVLGTIHRASIREVIGTDIDPEALRLAARNVALLSDAGLRSRAAELEDRAARFGKPAYAVAARGAVAIARRLGAGGGDVPARLSRADALDARDLARALDGRRPDLVIRHPVRRADVVDGR